MVIRHEYFGNLIWSNREKSYFIPKNEKIDHEVDKILKEKDGQNDILEELKAMGMKDGVREIKTNNKHLSAPLDYYFDYTNACNLKCAHCYNREYLNCDTMSEEQIEYVIKDMYDNGVMRLHLAGGEPTLFPEKLRKYMETAKKYGIVTSMSSNGTMVTDEIGDILMENDVISFTISLESANEEKNAKIRGKGSLERAKDGIRKIVEYRRRNDGKFNISIKMSYDVETTEETVESETNELSQMEQDANYIKSTISFIKPVNGEISSEFGWRNPTTQTVPKNHTGTDIAAETGTKIVSATDGTVVLSSTVGDYGNHLKIQINDVIIVYAHCNKLYVNEGDTIKQGQEIAEVGSTGNTTGPHLHFEVRYQDRYVNPQLILEL